MEKKRESNRWVLAGIVLALLALPIGCYVAAYFAMVDPIIDEWPAGITNPPNKYIRAVIEDYRWIEHDRGAWLFWPIHQIDKRLIRPALWKEVRPYG